MPGLAHRIRQRREALGMSQPDVARAMGGNASAVEMSHYENERRVPSAQKLIDLARALSCSLDWLMTGREAEERLEPRAGLSDTRRR